MYNGESFIPSRRLYDILAIILTSASLVTTKMNVSSIFFATRPAKASLLDITNKAQRCCLYQDASFALNASSYT
jgi:hypothetical protein